MTDIHTVALVGLDHRDILFAWVSPAVIDGASAACNKARDRSALHTLVVASSPLGKRDLSCSRTGI